MGGMLKCTERHTSPRGMTVPATKIVGIVNITEDSFSDGGRFLSATNAIAHAKQLAADGADIVELGPASSNPSAGHVCDADQIARLAPVFDALEGPEGSGIQISIDATKPAVQRYALSRGAGFINDIRGFPDASLYREFTDAACGLVVMHAVSGGETATRTSTDASAIYGIVVDFFEARISELEASGVRRENLILDPGMGFFLGTNPEASLEILCRIGELRRHFGLPVLISVSRKSFLRKIADRSIEDIGPATLAAELFAVREGVDYVRTHDVKALRDALSIANRLAS